MNMTLLKNTAVVTMCWFANTSGYSSEQADVIHACPEVHDQQNLLHTHELTNSEKLIVNKQLKALLKTDDPELILAAQILMNTDADL
jgi:hypothetical protein